MAFDLSKLGVKRNIPKVNFKEYTGIFEAPEKFGKTAFASLYPNAILLASEKGYMAQVMNVRDIYEWSDFVEFVDELENNREEIGDEVQTIIIDTVDELYPMASKFVVNRESRRDQKKYNTIKDIPYGQGWGLHDEEFKKQVKRIISMGFTILYLTHSTVKTVKPKDGEPYDVYRSTMPDRCANIVYPACDYIIHGERRKVEISDGKFEMRRVLTVRGNNDAVAGNRVYFDEDVVFETEEEAMEKFQEKFREGIERNLHKAGIKTSIEVLEKQQLEEKHKQVEEYIEQTRKEKGEDPKVLIAKIDEAVAQLDDSSKKELGKQIKEILGMTNYRKSEDVDGLAKILALLQS